MKNRAVLLLSCPDAKGIVAQVTSFIYNNNGNIVCADQYTDFDDGIFFMRIEWELDGFRLSRDALRAGALSALQKKFNIRYSLYFFDEVPNIAVFVSRQDHCLLEILWRYKQGEFNGKISCIISNHDELRPVAEGFSIPYYHIPKNPQNRLTSESQELEIIYKNDVKLIVLAKYMQILSDNFVDRFEDSIINIHHSFLPAFEGARPYHRAHERGVKLIGATVHYVNHELDKGPIIEQSVVRVSHKDLVKDYIKKGRDLEKLLIVRGISLHLEHRILVYKNRTIVFD